MASCARRRARRTTHHRSIEPHKKNARWTTRSLVCAPRAATRREKGRRETRSIVDAPFAPWWRLSRARDARVRGCVRIEACVRAFFFFSMVSLFTPTSTCLRHSIARRRVALERIVGQTREAGCARTRGRRREREEGCERTRGTGHERRTVGVGKRL